MKLLYKVNEKLSFEVEAEGQKAIFNALASLDEVFGERKCGQCGKGDIYFRVRNTVAKKGKNKGKTFTYYELVCRSCGGFLPYGLHLEGGTMWPKRTLEVNGEKVYDKQHHGWQKPMELDKPDEEE